MTRGFELVFTDDVVAALTSVGIGVGLRTPAVVLTVCLAEAGLSKAEVGLLNTFCREWCWM